MIQLTSTKPVRLLARQNGKYTRPILVNGIDFRFEDNPTYNLQRLIRMDSSWVAHHPLDDLYIVCSEHNILATHATPSQIEMYIVAGQLHPDTYRLPTEGDAAWWQWVLALDAEGRYIKAPKCPRAGEWTPEQIDERGWLRVAAYYEWEADKTANRPEQSADHYWYAAEATALVA